MNNQINVIIERLLAFISGLIFGAGLIASQMTSPQKVQGFLDLFGPWDPSLAFVMGGAIGVALPFFALAKKRTQSLSGHSIQLPRNHAINKRLILGSITFGIGWGLAGYCPAPALLSAGLGNASALWFVFFMLIGFKLFCFLENKRVFKS